MKEFNNGGRIVERISELPTFENVNTLYLDFETTSRNDKLDSLNPWQNCWVLGIAVAVDDSPAYYVPIEHRHGENVDKRIASQWLKNIVEKCKTVVGHNLKYDLLVAASDLEIRLRWPNDQSAFCTVVHSKILDSDRQSKGGYSLDSLSRTWLYEDIGGYENKLKRWLVDSKDYAKCPAIVMAEYACQDILSTRRLKKYIDQHRHSDCELVAKLETDLTSVLFQMECNGLLVEPIELMKAELELSYRFLQIDSDLAELCKRSINPSSNDQLYDLFINQFGLPILGWTDETEDGEPAGNASFDKETLSLYASHPKAPKKIVELIQEARSIQQTLGLFVKPYQTLCDKNGRLHPSFNQMVRTGRMSCREPNMQQLSKTAKRLIHPGKGAAFLSGDESQIEFRVLVSYISNQRCIAAYNENPDVDFHQWVADTAGIRRKPAKNLNFCLGYGGGKKKALKMLSVNEDVVGDIEGRLGDAVGAARESLRQQLSAAKAESVYESYHQALPELKPTSRRAAAVCYDRGYIRNLHGRHRQLPPDKSHKAFNSLCQGEAADIQKERTVAIAKAIQNTPIMLVGNVHDEILMEGPSEVMQDIRTQNAFAYLMETNEIPLRVPLRCSIGYSTKNWAEASGDVKDGGTSRPLTYDVATINTSDPFNFLR